MRRIWILGNGPSLDRTNLNALVDEESIGLNRIHLIYPRTKWRPTYYFCTDLSRAGGFSMSQVESWNADMRTHAGFGYPIYTRKDMHQKWLAKDLKPLVKTLLVCREHTSPLDGSVPAPTAWHLPEYCRYGGTMAVAIQWAAAKGYDDILLVGADLGYGGADSLNHFDREYAPVDSYTPEQARWFNRVLVGAHEIAHRECLKRGIRIRNAGVGGNLAVYPRTTIDEALATTA